MFGFGMSALAMSFTIVVLPTRILDVAPEESKNTYLGVLSFVGLLIAVIVQPVVGGLSDRARTRWGRRAPFIAVGATASLPLIVAVGVAPSYVLLFVFICALQLTSNSALGPFQGLIRDLIPRRHRGAASGMKTMVEIAGAMIITGVVGVLMGRYQDTDNFLWVWAATGVLAAMMVPGSVVTTVSVAKAPPAPVEEDDQGPTERSTKAHPDYPWFLLSRFFMATGAVSIGTFALFFLEDRVGIENPAQELWKFLPVVGGAVLLVSYPAGLLADRAGRKPVMLVAGVLGALSAAVLLTADSVAGVMVVAGIVGAAMGMFLGANWAMATDLVSSRRTAQQLAYLNIATAGGAGVARLNGIWVDALNKSDENLGYSVLIVLCGILFLVGTVLILKVRLESRPQLSIDLGTEDRPA
ncbi:MAG: MFS transporter [Dehalococcoidia bacterium]